MIIWRPSWRVVTGVCGIFCWKRTASMVIGHARRDSLGFDAEAFVCTELSQQAGLPWDFLASERQMQRLHREHDRALALPVLASVLSTFALVCEAAVVCTRRLTGWNKGGQSCDGRRL